MSHKTLPSLCGPDHPTECAKVSYSIPEACEATGLSRSMLYLALRDGRLTARKAGARTIVERSELMRFIESLPATGGEAP